MHKNGKHLQTMSLTPSFVIVQFQRIICMEPAFLYMTCRHFRFFSFRISNEENKTWGANKSYKMTHLMNLIA